MSPARFRPVAIVGVGCVFPQANSVEAFWSKLLTGGTALGVLNEREFRSDGYFDSSPTTPDRTHCRHGALVDELELDARRYRIPPKVLRDMHRMQLAFIDATAQALDDARRSLTGVAPERVGLVLGSTGGGLRPGARVHTRLVDMLRSLSASRTLSSRHPGMAAELSEALTVQLQAELSGTSETEATASFSSIWAGRAAKLFDLRGPHFTVDAGHASSLAAIQSASQQLNSGDCDVVLASGCSQLLTPHDLVAFGKQGALGTSSLVPFDSRSGGTLLGEGVGVFVLRRLEDAVASGAKVYAVIRGIGAASSGASSSLLTPGPKGQVLAMREAYARAGYGPREVQYVECHGSGIPEEDATELASLRELWSEAEDSSRVRLGAVKELTGHLQAASGAAGLLKVALSLFHKVLPPQHTARDSADLRASPFHFAKTPSPWPPVKDGARRASVNAIGLGGLNYHLTLEEFSADAHACLAATLRPPRPPEPIAIVGLGGIFPGASDVASLWGNLLEKRCAIGAIPPERAETARYLDPTRKSKARPYTNLAGYVVDGSWPQERVRVSEGVAAQIDRGQSWTMRAALQALDDAGHSPGSVDPRRVAVAMGYMPPLEREFQTQARVYYAEFDERLEAQLRKRGIDAETARRIRDEVEAEYKRELPPINAETLPGYLGSLAVARVAHHLDFQGPVMMVESACASSLAAVDIAANFLHTRESDLVLAGGMYATLGVDAMTQWCSFGGLSQSGSFPFDARADGYVTSEGAAMLALKRLSDAEAAGDRIYAVIRAVAGATDPKSASIWAPSSEGQAQAVRRAVEKAGVTPEDIQYLEGHGTGTPVGDPVEVETYRAVYGRAGAGRKVFLGSIKSNLGHLNSGAGAASLLKVALALHHGQVPPNAGFATPNPVIPWRELPFHVPTRPEPWEPDEHGVRRAGVTSLGLGGTSFHAVVEEHVPKATVLRIDGAERGELLSKVEHLLSERGHVPDRKSERGADDVETPCRFAVALPSGMTARRMLSRARDALAGAATLAMPEQGLYFYDTRDSRRLHERKVAWVFAAGGSAPANGLHALAERYPEVLTTLDDAASAFEDVTGQPLRIASGQDGLPGDLSEVVTGVAYYRLLRARGLRVDILLGEGAGEYSALAASGMLSMRDTVRALFLRSRARAHLDSRPSRPGASALQALREGLVELAWSSPQVPVLSAVHGRYHEASPQVGFLARHLALLDAQPSRFHEHVRRIYDDGVRVFLEAGSGESLAACLESTPGIAAQVMHARHPAGTEAVERFQRLWAFSDVHRLLPSAERARALRPGSTFHEEQVR
ncbi:beta-ketoacyl synthase N-terminal-like domain-containing protein [Myxococcus stipitatus]|uniref:beta-ketoacyl synthase N-terminal-like domain-containing protein n=1 Tax=Myxococcus stipitatus TaxID=83455 RepID=UPI0030CE1E14